MAAPAKTDILPPFLPPDPSDSSSFSQWILMFEDGLIRVKSFKFFRGRLNGEKSDCGGTARK